jgi:hypothetical protein
MNEIFLFLFSRDDYMVSKSIFMFCAHEAYDNEFLKNLY